MTSYLRTRPESEVPPLRLVNRNVRFREADLGRGTPVTNEVTFSTTFTANFFGTIYVTFIRVLIGRELNHLQKSYTKQPYSRRLLLYCRRTKMCDAFRVFGRRLFCGTSLSLRLART